MCSSCLRVAATSQDPLGTACPSQGDSKQCPAKRHIQSLRVQPPPFLTPSPGFSCPESPQGQAQGHWSPRQTPEPGAPNTVKPSDPELDQPSPLTFLQRKQHSVGRSLLAPPARGRPCRGPARLGGPPLGNGENQSLLSWPLSMSSTPRTNPEAAGPPEAPEDESGCVSPLAAQFRVTPPEDPGSPPPACPLPTSSLSPPSCTMLSSPLRPHQGLGTCSLAGKLFPGALQGWRPHPQALRCGRCTPSENLPEPVRKKRSIPEDSGRFWRSHLCLFPQDLRV